MVFLLQKQPSFQTHMHNKTTHRFFKVWVFIYLAMNNLSVYNRLQWAQPNGRRKSDKIRKRTYQASLYPITHWSLIAMTNTTADSEDHTKTNIGLYMPLHNSTSGQLLIQNIHIFMSVIELHSRLIRQTLRPLALTGDYIIVLFDVILYQTRQKLWWWHEI